MANGIQKDLGKVTAYSYAKAAGYTGTEEQFQAIFNEFTENAPGLIDRMDTAVERAEAAVTNIDATVQDAVDDAVEEATASAVATANQAVSDAQAAQTAAEGAVTQANAAVTQANAAVTAAQAAQSAAEDAAESFVLDRTLTDSGAAAPADLVGDLKESITQLEETQYSPYEEVTVTNLPVANLKDSAENVPVKQAVFDIIARQTGTGEQSPSNIRPLTGFTSARIGRSTKNLMRKFNNMYRAYCYLPRGTKIYFRYFSESRFNSSLYGYDLAGDSKTIATCYSNEIASITLQEDFSQIYLSASASEQIDSYNGTIVVATEPFTESEPYADTYNIEFPTEANTVFGGKLDVTAGKLIVTHLKQAFPTAGWTKQATLTNTSRYSFAPSVPMLSAGATNAADILCTQYPVIANEADVVHIMHRYSSIHVFVSIVDFPDVTTWQNYLSNLTTLPEVVYPLRDAIEYTLSPIEISTLLTTAIWADTGTVNTLIYRSNGNIDNKILLTKAIIAPVLTSMVADTALVANDFRIVGNTLYRITTPVASGATLTPDTNCTATTIADILKSLLS